MFKSKDRSPLNNAGQQVVGTREGTTEAKRVVPEVQQKLEDLQIELQEKEATILALQRNYEGISLIYKEEKSKSLEWSEKIQAMDRDNSALKSKMQNIETQRLKVVKDLEKAQEELGKFYRSTEEYRACRLENQTNKMLLEKKVTVI
jgi:chromosome segregation ATPase